MSDKLQEQAKHNTIIEIITGSNLYGTSTPTSDKDYIGVFMPPTEYIIGLNSVSEVDLSIKSKNEDGKNTKEATDKKLYEFRKFLNLALGSNPNILEILFVNDDSIISIDEFGEKLLDLRHCFVSKLCMTKFLGYAKSQKHKMIIKREHIKAIREGYKILNENDDSFETMESLNKRYPDVFVMRNPKDNHIKCGDLYIERGVYSKKARRMIGNRLDNVTNRTDLILKHGYDTKFGSHLIRLLLECVDLLEKGELAFPLRDADMLLEIKEGKWKIEKVIEYAEKLEDQIKVLETKTKIPSKPNFNKINDFCQESLSEFLSRQ